jgi:hypothetical protein
VFHTAARKLVVNTLFQELGHPRDIYGRQNIAGVVNTAEGLVFGDSEITQRNAVPRILEMIAIPHVPKSRQSPEAITAATPHMEEGWNVVIRGTSNSKIIARFLQGRETEIHGGGESPRRENQLADIRTLPNRHNGELPHWTPAINRSINHSFIRSFIQSIIQSAID